MEPWTPLGAHLIVNQPAGIQSGNQAGIEADHLAFEDSFSPSSFKGKESAVRDDHTLPFAPLSDTVEYLARLEAKLKNLQGKNRPAKDKHKEELTLLKEAAFNQLLRADANGQSITTDQDIDLGRELTNNWLVRTLLPEQPICAGETVRLISSDHLEDAHKPSHPEALVSLPEQSSNDSAQ